MVYKATNDSRAKERQTEVLPVITSHTTLASVLTQKNIRIEEDNDHCWRQKIYRKDTVKIK